MKALKCFLIFAFLIQFNNSCAQVGILVNPYSDYSFLPSPTYINSQSQVLQTVHNNTTVPGFTGEYEINLDYHQWKNFQIDHVVTYDFEVVGFPFTMDCAFQPNSCADCSNERKLFLPHTIYNDITHTWNQYLYNDMQIYGAGEFSGDNSVLPNGHHQTLITDFFNKDIFPQNPNRIYFPHTSLRLNLYLHCNDNYVNPGAVISKLSYIYDNTRGRMRFYPFKEDNCPGSAESNYDVIFRPTTVNSPSPIVMYYDDYVQDNSYWTEGLGTINYHKVTAIDLNGCSSVSIPAIYWDHDIQTGTSSYNGPLPGPYALQTCHLFGSEAWSLAGYLNEPDKNDPLVKNEGIEHQYNIDDQFNLDVINSNEKIIYNPSKVRLAPHSPFTFFNITFPELYTFKTIRGTFPTVSQINDDNIAENGGPFYSLELVPVRTDLRSEDPAELHDENVLRHSVYASIYTLESGSQITIGPCVSLYDLCFDVNEGSNLIISDYSQIRGKEDMSSFTTGRFKIRGKGGAILRNYAEVQYVQNGIIYQPTPLHYIATDIIISGEDVSVDNDQLDGIYEVQNGGEVTFEAGNYIHLTNGFYVSGGNFHAVINPNMEVPPVCFGQNRYMSSQFEQEPDKRSRHLMILKVSPNPSLDNILVKNVSVLDDHFTVDVYDYLGQKVFTAKAQKDKNLNIENLIPGFYMLKVIESNQTIKFIKQ